MNGIANIQRFETVSFHGISINRVISQFKRPGFEKRRFRVRHHYVANIKWQQPDLKTSKIIVATKKGGPLS